MLFKPDCYLSDTERMNNKIVVPLESVLVVRSHTFLDAKSQGTWYTFVQPILNTSYYTALSRQRQAVGCKGELGEEMTLAYACTCEPF